MTTAYPPHALQRDPLGRQGAQADSAQRAAGQPAAMARSGTRSADIAYETDQWGRFVFIAPDPVLGWPAATLLGQPGELLLACRGQRIQSVPCDGPVRRRRAWLKCAGRQRAMIAFAAAPLTDAEGRSWVREAWAGLDRIRRLRRRRRRAAPGRGARPHPVADASGSAGASHDAGGAGCAGECARRRRAAAVLDVVGDGMAPTVLTRSERGGGWTAR